MNCCLFVCLSTEDNICDLNSCLFVCLMKIIFLKTFFRFSASSLSPPISGSPTQPSAGWASPRSTSQRRWPSTAATTASRCPDIRKNRTGAGTIRRSRTLRSRTWTGLQATSRAPKASTSSSTRPSASCPTSLARHLP